MKIKIKNNSNKIMTGSVLGIGTNCFVNFKTSKQINKSFDFFGTISDEYFVLKQILQSPLKIKQIKINSNSNNKSICIFQSDANGNSYLRTYNANENDIIDFSTKPLIIDCATSFLFLLHPKQFMDLEFIKV
jgi:hypothetical protein